MEHEDGFKAFIEFSKEVPISALRASSKKQLSNHLDSEGKVIGDYTNDWYGLAEIIGYLNSEIRGFEKNDSPTTAVLENWATRSHFSPTVDKLIKYLIEIQRPDVVTESEKPIRKDIEHHQKPTPASVVMQPVVQNNERYDAFVVYANTDKDIKFMRDMVEILEGAEHGVKLYVPGRDDYAGSDKYPITADMIANRCRRVIVVLSAGFQHSEDCDFALKFAQSLSPGAKTKRIIPILIDNISIPLILNSVKVVNFTNPMQREWAWPRVAATIKSPLVPSRQDLQCTIDDLKNMRYESEHVRHMFYGLGIACRNFPEEDDT